MLGWCLPGGEPSSCAVIPRVHLKVNDTVGTVHCTSPLRASPLSTPRAHSAKHGSRAIVRRKLERVIKMRTHRWRCRGKRPRPGGPGPRPTGHPHGFNWWMDSPYMITLTKTRNVGGLWVIVRRARHIHEVHH